MIAAEILELTQYTRLTKSMHSIQVMTPYECYHLARFIEPFFSNTNKPKNPNWCIIIKSKYIDPGVLNLNPNDISTLASLSPHQLQDTFEKMSKTDSWHDKEKKKTIIHHYH